MDSTPTTEAGGPQRLGGGGWLGYEPTGGHCVRDDCENDAPQVRMGGDVLRLPCSDHADEIEAEWAREEKERLALSLLVSSGLTARQEHFSLDSYERECDDAEGRAALAVARRWLASLLDGGDAGNLLLYGPIGTGKTGLAAGLVRALCGEGKRAQIVNFKSLLTAMKDCFDRHQPTSQALGVGRAPVLVLDDIGAERPTEWARDELLGIVDFRYERGLPTIYVSNYSPADLARRLSRSDSDLIVGQRIVSRMRERALVHEFKGRDRRLPV